MGQPLDAVGSGELQHQPHEVIAHDDVEIFAGYAFFRPRAVRLGEINPFLIQRSSRAWIRDPKGFHRIPIPAVSLPNPSNGTMRKQ